MDKVAQVRLALQSNFLNPPPPPPKKPDTMEMGSPIGIANVSTYLLMACRLLLTVLRSCRIRGAHHGRHKWIPITKYRQAQDHCETRRRFYNNGTPNGYMNRKAVADIQ